VSAVSRCAVLLEHTVNLAVGLGTFVSTADSFNNNDHRLLQRTFLISQDLKRPYTDNLRMLGLQLNLVFIEVCVGTRLLPWAWTGCWKELLTQPWMACHLVHTHLQIWTLPTMSLFLLSYSNSSYLHLRRCHQKPHLSGSSWTGRRQKFKLWAAGRMNHRLVQRQSVAVDEEFVYLGSLIYLTTQSSPNISRHNTVTLGAVWSSQSVLEAKNLRFSCMALECWAVTKRDVHKIDALDQWCVQKLLGIKCTTTMCGIMMWPMSQKVYY